MVEPIEAAARAMSLDIVSDLRSAAAQLMRTVKNARLWSNGLGVRLTGPEILHATLSDAADIIEDMRSKHAAEIKAAHRAGQEAMRKRAVSTATDWRKQLTRGEFIDAAVDRLASAIAALPLEDMPDGEGV